MVIVRGYREVVKFCNKKELSFIDYLFVVFFNLFFKKSLNLFIFYNYSK